MVVKRVCVIGAGVAGLVAIKSCLEEGLEPVCLEKDEEVGGVWTYREGSGAEGSALYECLVTNSSREMMCYSDYPFPKETPPYIPGRDLNEYYKSYADHFQLRKHIQFHTEVLRIEEAEDYATTGRWSVKYRREGEEEKEEIFDAIMLCTGMFSDAKLPTYPGQETFEGIVIHSNDFRRNSDFAGMNVIVVGGSHSAGDVAVDTSRAAKQVFLSMRNGTWVIPRSGPKGWPRDLYMNRRINFMLPEWYRKRLLRNDIESRMNLDNLGLRCTKELFCSEVMVNDEIAARVISGKVKTKPGIDHFEKNAVVFTDGTRADNLDAVIYATGYDLKTATVDERIVQDDLSKRELFKFVWPPRLQHHTFACIGLIMTVGAHAPCFEMQARWATRVFKGLNKLPPVETMLGAIRGVRKKIYDRFGKHIVFFPPVPYTDAIAKQIGVYPRFRDFMFTDPKLAYQLIFGPAVPFAYRLVGSHQWKGAREYIMNVWETYIKATRTRDVPVPAKTDFSTQLKILSFFILLGLIFMMV